MGDSTKDDKPKKKGHSTRKKTPGPRASTTGGPGPRKTAPVVGKGSGRKVKLANWRTEIQASRLKFDDDAKARFLEHFRQFGRMGQAAEAAGVGGNTVRSHLDKDPDFAEAFQDAKDAYRDRVHETAYAVAVEGIDEPIIGGEFKDEVVAYKKVYATNILAMELKRVDPGYKERSEVDMNVRGGVLVAPAQCSPDEWIKQHGQAKPSEEEDGIGEGS